jgi:hypothetical protein
MALPLSSGEHFYALEKEDGLLCVRWQDGRVRWKDGHRLTPAGRNPHAAMVWIDDPVRAGLAAALNAAGELVLARLSPHGYEEHGRVQVIDGGGEPVWAHPAFAGQRVYARSDREIVCVEVEPPPPDGRGKR